MRLTLLIFLSCFVAIPVMAQEQPLPDTAAAISGTTGHDSVGTPSDSVRSAGGADTIVTYSTSDSIVFVPGTRIMKLNGKARIRYEQLQLDAEKIDIDWKTSTLNAYGVADTADTVRRYRGTPVMKDGDEELKGYQLSYNFRSKRGRIDAGDTQIDEGFYHGEEIKKVDRDILFVGDGWYTTCDAEQPHYYFYSPKMKITLQQSVIAAPVFLYIAGVPVFGLPFGVFPAKGGRRSGIITPAYGEDARRGRFLRHLGYYLALSEYMDLGLRSDLYTKGGWALFGDYRYALRYAFTGSLSGEYRRLHTGESDDPGRTEEESYRVNVTHNQEIDPTSRLNVNFTFASDNSYLNTINLQQALDQSIVSNATLSKSWEGTPLSVTANVGRNQNLTNGRIDETLPSLSLNYSQSYPFRRGGSGMSDLRWYEMVGVNYNAQAANRRSKYRTTIGGVRIVQGGVGTIGTVEEFRQDRRQTIAQSVGVNISPKLGTVTLSPFFTYRDERSFIDNDVPSRSEQDSTLVRTTNRESVRSGSISTGISAGTKLYGMARPGILGIDAFRHTLTPNLSLNYVKKIMGLDPVGSQMLLNFSLGNVFEVKTLPPEEGKGGSKIQLLNLGAGVSYNFSADSLKFSPIGVSYRTGIGDVLNLGGSANFDLYQLVRIAPQNYIRVNRYLISEEGKLARLTNFSFNISTSLSGERNDEEDRGGGRDTVEERAAGSRYYGLFEEEEPDFSIPWRLSLSWDYAENKVPPFQSRSSSVRGNLEFNLTDNWKFTMGGGYDLMNKEVLVPSVNISRDLHCWIMNFSWVPTGNYRHYQLEIRVKAPQLQDVKITKQGSDRGIY